MGSSGKKGGAKMQATDYQMSMHWGICWGPVDSLEAIYVGEKEAYVGPDTTKTKFTIARPDLFGGYKGEGGVTGNVWWLPGDPTQVLPDELADRLIPGATGSQVPGFRNQGTLFFIGPDGYTTDTTKGPMWVPADTLPPVARGFTWSTNNPYLKSIWAKVKRSPKGLNASYAMIGNLVSASISSYSITCDGVTDTVSAGITKIVNGHSFTLNHGSTATTLVVDGTSVTISDNNPSTSDYDYTVTIEGQDNASINMFDTLSIFGVKLNITTRNVFTIEFGSEGQDANGSHIIYECITNKDWGMGENTSSINTASFENAAKTLFNEAFGLSLAWYSSTTIEAFISEILDHIMGVVYTDPSTGLITLKLIRGDYDGSDIPVLTPDNCTIKRFDRKGWGETINEIVVTWTNPVNESEETVTVQNIANQAIQGNTVSDSRNYYAIRNQALALRVANRDLHVASTPLASFEIEVDRSMWWITPGSVARIVYPEEGIDGLIVRIGKVDYGKKSNMKITLDATEDIFGRPSASYSNTSEGEWVDPSATPTAMTHTAFMTVPYYFVEQNVSTANINTMEYPDVSSMALSVHATNKDINSFNLFADSLKPNGELVRTDLGNKNLASRATLTGTLPRQAETTIYDLNGLVGNVPLMANTFVMIGSLGERYNELCLVKEVVPPVEGVHNGGIKLLRGILDTVPQDWYAGTPVWFFNANMNIFDMTSRASGEEVIYNLLSNTSQGRLSLDDAPDLSFTLSDRPWLPYRPANCLINGQGYDVTIGTATSMTATWSNRNRLMEPVAVLRWDEDTIAPETGQKTKIVVRNTASDVLAEYDNISGSGPFVIPNIGWGSNSTLHVQFYATRDGLESWQGHIVRVFRTP